MKEDIKYPCIADNGNGTVVIFTRFNYGFLLKKSQHNDREEGFWYPWNESAFKNITRKYLANTYGNVDSKEHAEFIVELAEVNDIALDISCREGVREFFSFNEHNMLFFRHFCCEAVSLGRKQITIPLPPKKEISLRNVGPGGQGGGVAYSGDSSNTESNSKAADSDEWPKLGDEVLICDLEVDSRNIDFNNEKVKVIAKTESSRGVILTISHNLKGIGAIMLKPAHIKKPKTPEEELLDEFMCVLYNSKDALPYAEHIAKYMIDEYTLIKKKPQ